MIETNPTPRYAEAYRKAHKDRSKAFRDSIRWLLRR